MIKCIAIYVVLILISPRSNAICSNFYLYSSPQNSFKIYDNLNDALLIPDQVRALKLREKSLQEVPQELKKITNIEYLNLEKNFITLSKNDIEVISNLRKLKCLVLSSNKISEIDNNSISLMSKSVEILVLRDNKIKKIPNGFARMEQIQFVDLSYNQLESYPEPLLKMRAIHSVWIACNPIKHVDCNFSQNQLLESICFSNCEILSFSAIFPRSISFVSLKNNNIKSIGLNWENCTNLELINLTGNPSLLLPDSAKSLESKDILVR